MSTRVGSGSLTDIKSLVSSVAGLMEESIKLLAVMARLGSLPSRNSSLIKKASKFSIQVSHSQLSEKWPFVPS